jgi:hypothetical protein
MRVVAAVVVATLLHAALSVVAFLLSFTRGMARFETGSAPTWAEEALRAIAEILYFPFMHLAQLAPRNWFPGLWGYVPVLFNSLFWAILLVYGWHALHSRKA